MEQQIQEENTLLTTAETKNTALTKQAVKLMTTFPSWTNQQIANELEISRTTLWNLTKGPEAQELMRRELNEIETTLHTWIQELHQSTNPTNIRTAAKLQMDIATKLADKLRPTLTQTQTTNINIDLTKHIQQQQIQNEIISRMPPTMRNLYWQLDTQIRQEWNIPQ